mmetsp:Transcript_24662/g.35203  ORF Transcript_24662/g.35203 Transcript_24662/m.35203 type:complete len:162 (-) Transcript_24662:89-574(-)
MAGAASFIPSFRIRQFLDWAERHVMLEQLVSPEILERIVHIKETGQLIKGGNATAAADSTDTTQRTALNDTNKSPDVTTAYNAWVQELKNKNPDSRDTVNAILKTVQTERQRALSILEEEGGDVDEVVARVRKDTLAQHQQVLEQKDPQKPNEEEKKDDQL